MDKERPTPLIEDPAATRSKLECWLSERYAKAVSITEFNVPAATGMSNVTLLFDITWRDNNQTRTEAVVARLQPEVARPVFPDYDLAWFNYLDATFADGLGMPRLEGLPSYEDTIRQWQRLTGFPVRDYEYYLVFAGMRYGLILSRIMLAAGQDAEIQGNFACRLLQKTLARVS